MKSAVRIMEIAPYDVILINILKSRFRQTKTIMMYIKMETYVYEKQLKVIASKATGNSRPNIHFINARISG